MSVPLIGRDRDLVVLTDLIVSPTNRIVTLVGPAGVGKSRLARELVDRLDDHFHDFAIIDFNRAPSERSGLSELVDQLRRVAGTASPSAMEEPAPTEPAPVTSDLPEKRGTLLVLDGCEYASPKVAAALGEWLPRCPALRVLVTSRQPLQLYGENLFPVLPLPVPAGHESLTELGQVASVRLFLHGARAVRPRYALTVEDAPSVARICVLLDGLPLAIELAAARVKLFRPAALLARLESGLDVLGHGPSDVPEHQQNLRAAIAWSFDLLTEQQRGLLETVSVFPACFDLRAASSVVGTDQDTTDRIVEELADRSMIRCCGHQPNGEPRFGLLRTVRMFVLERLGGAEQLAAFRGRHSEYFANFAERVAADFEAGNREAELWVLRLDRENLLAAFDHLVERGEDDRAARLATAFWRHPGLANVFREHLSWLAGYLDSGRCQDPALAARAALACGVLSLVAGEPGRAEPYLRRARGEFERLTDPVGVALSLFHLGRIAYRAGALETARRWWEESLVRSDRSRDPTGHAAASACLAQLAYQEGELAVAERLLTVALADLHEHGDRAYVAFLLARLAVVVADRGRRAHAVDLCRRSLVMFRGLRHVPGALAALEAYVAVQAGGRPSELDGQLGRLLGAAESVRTRGDFSLYLTAFGIEPERRTRALLEQRLGRQGYARMLAQGRTVGLWDSVAEALGETRGAEPPAPVLEPAPEPEPGPALTHREQEVAELVAEGMTNRQIARRLGISEWTVVNHLRHVMQKLGCSSRTGVAQYIILQRRTSNARVGS